MGCWGGAEVFVRRVKIQLAVFAVLTVFGVISVAANYLYLPRLLGFGQYHVTAEFADASGLFPSAVVNYRGVEVGRVDRIELNDSDVAQVDLAIDDGVKIPADLRAQAASTSGIGEQYIELLPRRVDGPVLKDGSVISTAQTTGLPSTSQLLNNLTATAMSVSDTNFRQLLSEVTTAFSGSQGSVATLLDSAQLLLHQATVNAGPTCSTARLTSTR